jgi:SAM-dependent methyltransferase/Tfp pilus assembly protein PilF
MQKNKQFYDNFYTIYPVDIHNNPDRFRAVSDLLSGKTIDVGCGTGTLSEYYSGDYTGVDVSTIAIGKARSVRRKDAHFFVADFAKDAFILKEKFDSAYLGEFLEHISDDSIVFSNLKDLLKDNARIVASVPNGDRVPDESHCRTFTVASIRRDYSKYGKVRFHNWNGFYDRILFSIEFNNFEPDKIALVMICKDEQKGIEKSIVSALSLVDKVVVSIDDATTDKTKEIAEMYADELRSHHWENDFSKARNEAGENVRDLWVLFLDGHEYIESFGNIKEKLKLDVDGIFVTIRMETGMTFMYPRIYKGHLKFKNAVHNLVECNTKSADPNFVIVHDRENLQAKEAVERRNAQRNEIMPTELKKQLKVNPKNSRAHFHLANFYIMNNQLVPALKHYKKTVKYSLSHDEVFMAYLQIGRIHMQLGHSIRALWNFKSADDLIPDRWESARVLGGFYLLEGNFDKAVVYLIDALRQNKRHYTYEPMTRNYAEIWDLIGHCFNKLNRNEEAKEAWERALELAETDGMKGMLKQKIQLIASILPTHLPVNDLNEKGKV